MATSELSAYERNVSAVVGKARECLTEILQESGTILYSSCETLKPGDYYFLGVNPCGSPEETKRRFNRLWKSWVALTRMRTLISVGVAKKGVRGVVARYRRDSDSI